MSLFSLCVWIGLSTGAIASEASLDEAIGTSPELNKNLLGEQRFGVYAHGDTFVGTLDVKVAKAKRVKGGGYDVRTSILMGLGENQLDIKESAVIAADFSTLAAEGRVIEGVPSEGGAPLESKRVFQDGEHWVIEMRAGENSSAERVPIAHPNRAGMWSMMLLARQLSGVAQGRYSMFGVLPSGGEPTYREMPLTVDVGPQSDFEVRGVSVAAQLMQVSAETGWVFSLVVSEGRLLEMWSNDFPTIFAACSSDAECQSNLGKGLSDDNLALGPIDAMRVLLNVMSGQLDASALDSVVDWEACSADFEKHWNEKPDPATLAAAIKAGFQSMSDLDPDLIESKLMMLEVSVEGDNAIVRIPDQSVGFRLKKIAERWMIVGFPG